MSTYTCISCRVAFSDAEIQRAHYKTDWHRYNLKRKVADMPPVTSENFKERVLAQKAAVEKQSQGTEEHCFTCGKKFSTTNAFENHLKSRKHQDAEKKASMTAQKEVERLNEKNLEKGLDENVLDHDAMNVAIQEAIKAQQAGSPKKKGPVELSRKSQSSQDKKRPEKPPRLLWFEEQSKKLNEEEKDLEDGEEDSDEWEDMDEDVDEELEEEQKLCNPQQESPPGAIPITDCLFCTHHSRSFMKNLAHMTKDHSFFIPDVEYLVDLQGLLKYLGEKVGVGNVCLWCNEKGKSFYSTEAVQSHMIDKSHCKLFTDGDAALEFADFYDFRSSYPDYKEGDADVEMHDDEVSDRNAVEYDEETMELILPSGAKIGHRSLMRYYKQRFGISRALVISSNRNAVRKVLQQYRALGWSDSGKDASHYRQRDMQYVQRMKSKWMLRTGMSNNATKQMHFRPQVRF
ncbi:cytoplasmic 60S subunit biogenesis factor ZNF622 [Erpetoichthys calabaricus]|uniref:Cytoplasmic 60S subunit biogenesis factor ZNF622 n=1 Tax=Erpetoichthys calabaricus TaxID=27687 RepID=A0A8C4RSG6_ERPCA|nr:cytoplasmic 60S subunit biogenesis factor ZNF622 [Erpetoichthys calabaricus]XP_028659637.1 cytoplasmic 60S subunit biogenesis factor ZNF622 [Erpetoichthys calabaricus]XP_028659639.1 cytoplasmic 60S subunit biogenesis factor ZNF622 [Erpetoichthys calabaricus]